MSFYSRLREDGESASERYVDVTRRESSAVITFAEPERLNVLSAPLVVQTKAAIAELAAATRAPSPSSPAVARCPPTRRGSWAWSRR
jgi:hypothetical protein